MGLMLAALPVLANETSEKYRKIAYDFEHETPVCTPVAESCVVINQYINTPGHKVSYPCYAGQKVSVKNRTANNFHLEFQVCVNDKIVTVRPGEKLNFIGVRSGDKLVWKKIDNQ